MYPGFTHGSHKKHAQEACVLYAGHAAQYSGWINARPAAGLRQSPLENANQGSEWYMLTSAKWAAMRAR